MTSPLVRLFVLVTAVALCGPAWGQSTTPFGTPSLLPVQDQYANWQSNYQVRNQVPAVSQPVRYHQVPPGYGVPAGGPLQYAAASLHAPAGPAMPGVLPGHLSAAGPQPSVLSGPYPGRGYPAAAGLPGARAASGPVEPGYDVAGEVAPDALSAAGCGSGLVGDDPCGVCGDDYGCWGGDCVSNAICCGPRFYAGLGGLVFTRNRPRFQQVSFDDTNLVGQVISTDIGLGQWDLGAQATLGWYVNPCTALEVTYWGLYGDLVESTVYASAIPGNLNTVFDFSPLNIGATNVNDLFDAAQAHRVRRDYDVNNVEINLLGGAYPVMASGFQFRYLGGVRWLRFAEDFFYASADANAVFGADLANEAYYDIAVRNNLWGVQLGGRADWHVARRLSFYAAPKFGLYANYMEQRSHIYNANGTAVVGPGNPLAGGAFQISSDKTIASFVGEIDLGMQYQFTPCLGAGIGYRAIAVSGLAYCTDQIPSHFADLPGVAAIDSNADLILHGGYASVTVTW